MSTTTDYTVSGMTCEHCVRAVAQEVSALNGVRTVTIDLPSGSLTVTSEAVISLEQIEAAVDEAGYTVVAAGAS